MDKIPARRSEDATPRGGTHEAQPRTKQEIKSVCVAISYRILKLNLECPKLNLECPKVILERPKLILGRK
jgi:hypothetical protein